MQAQSKRIQKLITFSPELYELVNRRARRYGMNFAEYIRHVSLIDAKDENEHTEVIADDEVKMVGEGVRDYQAGKYVSAKTKKEIDTFLNQLFKKINNG